MYLIVGLGNPGKEYEKTRHNMGFNVVDELAEKYQIKLTKHKYEGLYGTGEIEGQKVVLLKPQTYMNLSGDSIGQFVSFYKLKEEEILVIYDDIDVPAGTIKIRKQGGPGTHNGMRSVVSELASEKFARIRVGTGNKDRIENLSDFVLERIPQEEWETLQKGVHMAAEAVQDFLKNGIDNAMNHFN